MGNVSTRPQKSATAAVKAVTTAVAASTSDKAASPIENEAYPWLVAAIESRNAVSKLVYDAQLLDDEERDDSSGMAKRLMSLVVSDLCETSEDADKALFEHAFFNAEALIYGALNLPSDPVGPKVQSNLRHALVIIHKMTDHLCGGLDVYRVFDAIRTAPAPAPAARTSNASSEPQAQQFNGHTARQVNLVLEDITSHAHTLRHFVRNVGDLDHETAFELVAMGLQIIGASADQLAVMTAVGGACEWMVGENFYESGKAVQA